MIWLRAAQHKLHLICEDLELKPEDHLIEIGTGWGGMAIYAAEHYGCRVTTTTISREQFDYTVNARRQRADCRIALRFCLMIIATYRAVRQAGVDRDD